MSNYSGNKADILGMLPRPRDKRILVEENQSVGDIISLITFAHKRNLLNYDRIAGSFWTGDVYTTCKKIFDFCKKNIHYLEESEVVQTVRSPQRILSEGAGDCKHYASFIGGILDGLNRKGIKISWVYRFASYRIFDNVPGHVFVCVKDGADEIWIDPVLNNFNFHKPYAYSIDKKMIATGLSGMGCRASLGSIGRFPGQVGATAAVVVKDIGGAITVVAPFFNYIPLVGTVVFVGLEVIGGIMKVIGGLVHNYTTSTGQRWLTQLYEYYVLSNGSSTSDHHVDERFTLPAQTWFSIALGVPIYDRPRFDAIKGIGRSKEQAVMDYMKFPDVIARGVPTDAVAHAYDIAQTMNYHDAPGGWADMKPANVLITNQPDGLPGTPTLSPASITVPSLLSELVPGQSSAAGKSFPWALVVVGGGILLLMSKKR